MITSACANFNESSTQFRMAVGAWRTGQGEKELIVLEIIKFNPKNGVDTGFFLLSVFCGFYFGLYS